MKYRLIIAFLTLSLMSLAQEDTVRPIHSVTIYKAINDNNNRKIIFIKIDSLGRVYLNNTLTTHQFEIKNFNSEITKYCSQENLNKYPGNNDVIVIEAPTPVLNKQNIIISIKFLDDVNVNDKNLINKTYYSWGKAFDKNTNSYPLFDYLSEGEVLIIRTLLE